MAKHQTTRRHFVQGAVAAAGAATLGARPSEAAPSIDSYIAKPPAGFTPFTAPGKITKVSAKGDFASFMQPNQLWPKPEIAKSLLEKAMMEFTGGSNLNAAMGRFISKDDVVAIKVNGIAGQKGTYTMATNYEVILPVVESVLALGVPASKITVYEQFPDFLAGTRVGVRKWTLPAGVVTGTHNNQDHKMPEIAIYQGVKTKYARIFTDAFKIMYDKGPLDKDPKTRIPHGALYACTDPIAMDTMGVKIVNDERKQRNLPSLKDAGREPRYIQTGAEFGLGVHDLNQIRLQTFEV